MPTHRTPEIKGKDEVKTKRADKSKQRMGIRKEKAEAKRVHTRMGWVLSPCRYETPLS